jgi:hypothetical protein
MRYSQVGAGLAAVLVAFSAVAVSAAPTNDSATQKAPAATAPKAQSSAQAAEQQTNQARSFSYEATPYYPSYRAYRWSSSSPRYLHADRKLRGEY